MSETINNTTKGYESNNSNTLSRYEQRIINKTFGFCSDCNRPNTDKYWCQHCNSKRFQQNFDKWTSGNEHVDKFIQEIQLKARNHYEVLEWISYNRLRNIQYLAQGGFSTVYKAIWLNGNIKMWVDKEQKWRREIDKLEEDHENAGKNEVISPLQEDEEKHGIHVVLKSLNNSSNIHEGFLNEWENCLQFLYSANNNDNSNGNYILIYGITQDPKTLNYMIVLERMQMGNLRSNLTIKKYNPNDKYHNLYSISSCLLALHKCNLIHGDFHNGNLLFLDYYNCLISDFGLSRPAGQSINSGEIYGVLPYIAPEVLRGKLYTKAADVYSFGIVMWEFTSGIPAFNDVPHDFNLSLRICKGYRPKVIEGTDSDYAKLMKRCWNTDPNKRPTAEELEKILWKLYCKYPMEYDKRTQIPEDEPVIKNHPLSCYTSRNIDYSGKLSEILNQEKLSSKILINEEEEDYENETSSEELEYCKVSSSKIANF